MFQAGAADWDQRFEVFAVFEEMEGCAANIFVLDKIRGRRIRFRITLTRSYSQLVRNGLQNGLKRHANTAPHALPFAT